MALSPASVAVHAATAGWRGTDLVTAVAVAYAESGGWPDRPGGLWGLPGEPGGDPAGNASKAHARQLAGGWSQWDGYTSRRYLLYMPLAGAAVAAPQVVAIITADAARNVREGLGALPGADVLDTARSALTLGVKAGGWMAERHNWVRVAQVVAGAGLLFVGVAMIARPDQTLGSLTRATIGKALKGR